jgi:hypothetical protein
MQVGRSSALVFVRHCLVLIYCVAAVNPGKLPSVLTAQFKQRKKEGISVWLIYLCLYTATSMMTSTLQQLGYIAHDVNMTDEDDIVEMPHLDRHSNTYDGSIDILINNSPCPEYSHPQQASQPTQYDFPPQKVPFTSQIVPTRQDWELHRPSITKLYKDGQWKLKDVVEHM